MSFVNLLQARKGISSIQETNIYRKPISIFLAMKYVKYSAQIVHSYPVLDAYNLISHYQELCLEASLKLELLSPLLRNSMALTCVEVTFRLVSTHSTQRAWSIWSNSHFSRRKWLLFNKSTPVVLDIFFPSFEFFIGKNWKWFKKF